MRAALLLLAVIPLSVQAQQPWTLEDCIRYARENNITLKQAEVNERSTELLLKQARYNILPNLNADVSYQFNFGRVVDPTTYEFTNENIQTANATLSTGFTLFGGFSKMNYVKQQKHAFEASRFATEDAEQQLSLQVAQSFLQVLVAMENVKTAEEAVTLAEEQKTLSERLLAAGRVPEGSVFEADAQVARSQQVEVEARNARELALLNLQLILNLEPSSDFAVDTVLPVQRPDLPPDATGIIGTAISNQPIIKSAEASSLSSERALSVARGAYWPTITLFAGLYTNYSDIRERIDGLDFGPIDTIGAVQSTLEPVIAPSLVLLTSPYSFNDQLSDNFNQAVGVSVRIPIFNGAQARLNVEQAKLQTTQMRYQLEQQIQNVRNTVQQAYANAVAAWSRLRAAETSLQAAAKAFEYTKKRNAEGLVTPYDYNASQNNLTTARSELTGAKYEYHFMRIILDYYAGTPITTD